MSTKINVAITDDSSVMRCRLLIKLIEIAGANPVLVPFEIPKTNFASDEEYQFHNEQHLESVRDLLKDCQAVIIPGNSKDIHPHLYGSDYIHPETFARLNMKPNNLRGLVEIEMVEHVIKTQKPLLGICGGMQIANIALGGSLTQHLPDDKRTDNSKSENYHYDERLRSISDQQLKDFEENFLWIATGKTKSMYQGTHPMLIEPESKLAEIYRSINPTINLQNVSELSIHHQGCFVENLSPDLKVAATAPDGVIEAAEHKNHQSMFLLMQFHPECNASGIAIPLVQNLLKSA